MKKLKRLKKPKLVKSLKRPVQGVGRLTSKAAGKLTGKSSKSTEDKVTDALAGVPRITNETVSEHREEVLSSARKYIYPLQHSKHRVVKISLSLFALVIISFFGFCGLALYKFQSTSSFIYDVTRIIPFPVAKTGSHWVGYESYLFELRRNIHYYRSQQQATFDTKDGKNQLKRLKQQAMNQVTLDAYVKQLAVAHNVSVSQRDVDNAVLLVRSQNRLGGNDRAYRAALSEFYGWNDADFKRKLKQQLLQQAVVSKLDTGTHNKATAALKQLRGGADFAALAGQLSDDQATKGAGGQYPNPLTKTDQNTPLHPAITAAIFKLQKDQVSEVIDTGYTLEIIKALDVTGNNVRAAHIQFNFQPITTYTKPLQASEPPHRYIKL
jgi:hypothetical protein